MRIFGNTKKLNIYKSLDNLKILTFWKIIQDKCIMYLDFDYHDGKKYTPEQQYEIELTWHRLYDEYYLLIDDPKSKSNIDKTFRELKTIELINAIKANLDFLETLKNSQGLVKSQKDQKILDNHVQTTYQRLESLDKRIKLKYFEGIESNQKILGKYINALINKYNIDVDNNKKAVTKEINNVYEVVASAESWLERNININDMVCSHWIAIEKQVRQKQKASQKNNGK